MWYLWIQLGSANANFYFATTLSAVSGVVLLLTVSGENFKKIFVNVIFLNYFINLVFK